MGNENGKSHPHSTKKKTTKNEPEKKEVNSENKGNDEYFLESWEVLTKDQKAKTSDTINFDNNLLISEIKRDPTNEYQFLKNLGKGTFGCVFKVKHNISGAIRAMKVIPRQNNANNEKEVLNEINILKKVDHPYIIKIFEFYIGVKNYYLLTEYCDGEPLFDLINDKDQFTETEVAIIMHQILIAINYCHKMKIIHRDIKPENILLKKKSNMKDYYRIAICDFGTSHIFKKGDVQNQIIGSPYYIAPEVLRKQYNNMCDLWSCGVIMYILLAGKVPFEGDSDEETFRNILDKPYDTSCLKNFSPACFELVTRLMEKDPAKRITAEEAINHKFFVEHKTIELLNNIKKEKIDKMINNLKNYKCKSVLQETTIAYLVHNYPDLEDAVEAGKLFSKIDVCGKGKVTLEEFYANLSIAIDIQNDELRKDINEIFNNLDTNHDNYVGYEDFVRAAVDKSVFLSENVLRFAFNYFDSEKKGEINIENISSIFGENIKSNNVYEGFRKIISEVDLDGDGKIQFEEFKKLMVNLLK